MYPRNPVSETWMELAQVGSGVALVVFMWSHVMLVSSVLLGAETMNRLAAFLEDTKMAYLGSPIIVLLFLVHAVLAARKIPFQYAERKIAAERLKELAHWDSITWGVQVVTGMAILVLGTVHLWVILTDFPIRAEKSGARVHGVYLWFYLPLLLAIELHASVGLYRAVVKWGWVPRGTAHRMATLMTVFFLGLGSLTLYTLWRVGAA